MGEAGRVDGASLPVHVLIGVTGSVAAIKLGEILRCCDAAVRRPVEVRLVATAAAAAQFLPAPAALSAATAGLRRLSVALPPLADADEARAWRARGDPILHIQLRDWSDVLVLVPLSANSLAKIAAGICDNLLTCVVRAWDPAKPALLFPAMNTRMWESPLTEQHLRVCRTVLKFSIESPIEKRLMCGDEGMGALPEPEAVAARIAAAVEAAAAAAGD